MKKPFNHLFVLNLLEIASFITSVFSNLLSFRRREMVLTYLGSNKGWRIVGDQAIVSKSVKIPNGAFCVPKSPKSIMIIIMVKHWNTMMSSRSLILNILTLTLFYFQWCIARAYWIRTKEIIIVVIKIKDDEESENSQHVKRKVVYWKAFPENSSWLYVLIEWITFKLRYAVK